MNYKLTNELSKIIDEYLDKKQFIKRINTFLKKNNIEIIFKDLDIQVIKKIQKDKFFINNTNIKNKLSHILFNSKNKILTYKKKIFINNNKYFILFIYINIFIVKIIQNDKINFDEQNQKQYEIILKDIYSLLINMYKNKFISFHFIFLFLQFFFEIITDDGIYTDNNNINNIIYILNFVKKVIKITYIYINEQIDKELLNKDIRQIFEKVFIINDNTQLNNIIFCSNMLKDSKILGLLKLCNNYYGDNNIIDIENINYIKRNLINLFSNNFNHKHLEYFYNLSKKYLLHFDNNNNSNYNKYFFSLINGIIEFLRDIHKYEKIKKSFPDKYFIFDPSKKCGLKISSIKIINIFELGLSIIFSFYPFKTSDTNNNEPQVILSLNDEEENRNIFTLFLIKNNLYIENKYNKNQSLLSDNINFNELNICLIYYDQNNVFFILNEKISYFEINIKYLKTINIELGYNRNENNFCGIMGPVILFNSIINLKELLNHYKIINDELKSEYYLIAETLNKENNDNDNIFFFYEENNGTKHNNNKLKNINKIKKLFKNPILYINPDVILNNLYFGKKKYRDYQRNNLFDEIKNKNSKNIDVYYEFRSNKDICNSVGKNNSLFNFLINNHGFNYIILNTECIYNYLLIQNEQLISIDEFNLM